MAKSRTESLRLTLAGGHDFLFEYCCDLCDEEGNMKEAVGYCSNCKAYLCEECFNTHLRPKPSRHHQLLDQHQMPQDQQRTRLSLALAGGSDFIFEYCCDLCKRDGHENEAVGYCSNCREYLCTECFNHHLKPKPLRHHVLLDQHQMPKENKARANHIMDIHVSSRDDSWTPDITGCVVLPGEKLVLADYKNGNVKLVDLTRGDVVSRLELSLGIWGITQVSSTQVAVTSPYEQTIYFVNVKLQLKLDRKIDVKGQCHGIACINNNLVVSYAEPGKVEIISMKGNALQTVVTEDEDNQHFTYPWYIAISRDEQEIIYISDRGSQTVTCVDLTGRVMTTYEDDKLSSPRGLTVTTTGAVYVCGQQSHNVLLLTAGLTEGRELLQETDGIESPRSVYYCEATGRLYIGMYASDILKVFQIE